MSSSHIRPESLIGVHDEIDQVIADVAFFGSHLGAVGAVPGSSGAICCVLTPDAGEAIAAALGPSRQVVPFDGLTQLSRIRGDGYHHYNAEVIPTHIIQEHVRPLAGRVLIVTATGAKLWELVRDPSRRLCVIQVSASGDGIALLYGNEQHGSIPSIETPSLLAANAITLGSGIDTSAALHCHPAALVGVCSSAGVGADYQAFNRLLYTQKEGLLSNVADLIGVIRYHPSGSRALLEATIPSLHHHRVNLWQNHGVLIRERSLERCVELLEYAEDAALASLRAMNNSQSFQNLTVHDLERLVHLHQLQPDILALFASDSTPTDTLGE